MNAAKEWLKFAVDDIRSSEVLLQEGIYNMVCFHAQQAVEKSLKAFIRYHRNRIPYIYNLEELCVRCLEIDSSFSQFLDDCITLDIFYQPTRYPEAPAGTLPEGMPNKEQAKDALGKAKLIFRFVQKRLGFSDLPDKSSK